MSESGVNEIILDIKNRGDEAVLEYNLKFDKNPSKIFEVSKEQIRAAYAQVDAESIRALKFAAKNIRAFASAQFSQIKNFEKKTSFGSIGQKIIPLQKVGCYVPGGNYPLPSSALMSVIPAKVAGVNEIIVCSPKIAPITIVAADLAGANKIFNIGGAQAIAAMAIGTKQVPKVNKIVGPGNKYVAEAKQLVFGEVGIDFIAGPSEVLVLADETGNPQLIAADLLAQAEHDINSKATLITTSKALSKKVSAEIALQLLELSTRDTASKALKNGAIIVVKDMSGAIDAANAIAPEHLEIQVKNPQKVVKLLKNYGSLFIGERSAEALGDYCLGPNHILPTNGAARYTGGLSVRDFVKIVTVQRVVRIDRKLIRVAEKLAEIEGLDAHRKAARMRGV
ncbi:MAG: histidinol dehydrogenase [archaeon]